MKQSLLASILILIGSNKAIAATDGLPSATESQGEFQILLTITEPQQIRITNLENIEFDLSPSDTPIAQSLRPCIFMSGAITEYDLEIEGEVLTDRTTDYPYSVKFQSFDQGSVTDEVNLGISDSSKRAGLNKVAASSSPTCIDGRTTEVFVSLDQTTDFAITNGQASATITITVSPTTQ